MLITSSICLCSSGPIFHILFFFCCSLLKSIDEDDSILLELSKIFAGLIFDPFFLSLDDDDDGDLDLDSGNGALDGGDEDDGDLNGGGDCPQISISDTSIFGFLISSPASILGPLKSTPGNLIPASIFGP